LTDSNFIKNFKKIIKTKPPDAEIYAGQGKEMVNIENANLNELSKKVEKWGEQSFQGLVCGIFGCQENPKNQCPICGGSYCYEHIKIHFHAKDHDGVILREVKEL